MCITEYDEKRTMELFLEEGMKKGMKKGTKEGIKKGGVLMLWDLVQDETISMDTAAAKAGLSVDAFKAKAAALMAEEKEEYEP